MASVIKYIGHLPYRKKTAEDIARDKYGIQPDGSFRWDRHKPYSDNVRLLPPELQLKAYLDQILVIAFYHSFNGRGWNLLIDEYIDEVLANFECIMLPKFQQAMRDNNSFDQVVASAKKLVDFIKNGRLREKIDVDAVVMFRSLYKDNEDIPWIDRQDRQWVTPYLIWLNHYWTGYSKPDTATCIEKWFVPYLKFRCVTYSYEDKTPYAQDEGGSYTLDIEYHSMSTTFCASNLCTFEGVRKIAIYDYLARFNFAGVAIETIIGKLGDMCTSLDVFKSSVPASQKVFAIIRANVLGLINYGGAFGSCLERAMTVDAGSVRGHYGLFDATKQFINFLVRTYGATLTDKDIVAKLFRGFAETKEQKESADYLAKLGGSASADELHSFNKELGSLEALQFISQNNALLVAQSQDATNPKAAADGEDTENKESETKEGDSKPEEADSDNQDDKEEGDDSPDSDEDASGEAEEDDTTEGEDESDGDGETDEGSGQDEGSSDTTSSSDENDMPSEDEQPNTSDPRGFKFKVANPEAETTDSVMFREEMDHFLSNILANPPEDLSPQTIQTLTSLHRYWLHTLSIGTIMGIVGSCLKHLPESLKQLTTKCTE